MSWLGFFLFVDARLILSTDNSYSIVPRQLSDGITSVKIDKSELMEAE